MGYMKKLIAGSVLAVIGMLGAPDQVLAREGSVDLSGNNVACKGVSIYQDGYYRVSGRCDGLVYPYETTYNKYVLWGKAIDNGEVTRITEIDRGYFSGNISSAFNEMYITAEQNSLSRRASDKVIVSGNLSPFEFDKSKVTTAATPTSASAKTATTTAATVADTDEATSKTTAGTVVGKILTSLLVVILVIVVLAIGASLLFRSRGSVSA